MKGTSTFDGKMTGNRQLVDRYNESKGKGGGAKMREPKERGGESGGRHEPSGHDEIKKVVDEHGAAVSHTIHKTHQGYSSVTHHEDGHVHGPVEHGSMEEAHEHGAHAFDDADHLGDMPKDDEQVAKEADEAEAEGGGSSGTSKIGFMS